MTFSQTVTATHSPTATPTPAATATPSNTHHLVLKVYDPAGSLVATVKELDVWGSVEPVYLADNPLVADGSTQVLIRSASGNVAVPWDGKDDGGNLLEPGVYILQAQWTSLADAGQVQVDDSSFTLLRQVSLASQLIIAPNPAGLAGAPRLIWPSDPRVDRIEARIYNLAGELVHRTQVPAAQGYLAWDMSTHTGALAANGTYIWAVAFYDGFGQILERGTAKMVILWSNP